MNRKFIAKKVGLKVYDNIRGLNVSKYLKLYIKTIEWSRDKIINYQTRKLKELLIYSYENVPFYKKRFDEAGFSPDSFKYLDQLNVLPPLTKKDLRNNQNTLFSIEKNKFTIFKGASSGSTGEPAVFYHDEHGKSSNRAAIIFGKFLGGYRLGNPWINIWGNPNTVNKEWTKLTSKASKFIFNEIPFPAYRLNTSHEYGNLYNLFLNKKPLFIYGYTNAVYLFAKFLEENKLTINKVKGVFPTSEKLMEFQKLTMENHLGKVYDQYGSSEVNGIAAESIYDDYFSIIDPHVFVEFIDVYKDTNAKKILVTHLDNKVFPLIRYDNGDLAEPVDDSIRSYTLNYSKIKSIDGRVSDIIKLPDGGNLVLPSFFGGGMFKNVAGVKQYQIVQYAPGKLRINLVINQSFNEKSKTTIINTLNNYLPKSLEFNLVFNHKIINSKTGKFKLFIDETLLDIREI